MFSAHIPDNRTKGWLIIMETNLSPHKQKIKDFYTKYRHGIPLLLYMTLFLAGFAWLEKANREDFYVIHMDVDDVIPFLEVFVVPYFLWFAYVSGVVVFLFLKNKQEYYRVCIFLFTGMTIFLLISALWPNGHHLRPAEMPRDNIFTQMVSLLWKTDTPTNLWPSIHVYNSLGVHFALVRSAELKGRRGIKAASLVLALSIILSTLFIKQHSMFDVLTGIALSAVMYALVYRRDAIFSSRLRPMKERISV
jgi:membrane-associated phospholipid phosphatase